MCLYISTETESLSTIFHADRLSAERMVSHAARLLTTCQHAKGVTIPNSAGCAYVAVSDPTTKDGGL